MIPGARLAVGACLAATLLAGLPGCGERQTTPAYTGSDISGEGFGRRLDLTDTGGVRRTLQDFRGRVVVLSFGYTHCPDVCPTTLYDLAQAVDLLDPKEREQVQVLFVTVDPARDTPAVLGEYIPYFNRGFMGLYGTEEEVARAAAEFRVRYRKQPQPGATGYLVDHTAGSFVLDKAGRLRLFLPFAHRPADIAHDLRLLLHE